MIYVESSALARAYLPAEVGHAEALALLRRTDATLVTGSWTRIEVSGALTRAAKALGRDASAVLEALDADLLSSSGRILTVDVQQAEVENISLSIVRDHGLRAMDAWHLACASIIRGQLADPGEDLCFATRDSEQAAVALILGFSVL